MEPHRWEKVKTLFHAALEQPAEVRQDFLARACADCDELREEVVSLLASYEGDGLPEPPAHGAFSTLLSEGDYETMIGRRVGAYQIDALVASGGMAHVYRATRVDGQFDRQVAVKVIKRGLDTSHLLRRFRAERQMLAGLDHPHIARLFDAGITEDGRPFLVMEFIEGCRIDRYCRDNALTIEARLRLFRDVCAAVHAAHQHLVIHRDLKPGNILVTHEGHPKLLDFGIAKLLEADSQDQLTLTVDRRPMTPEYASPEQVAGRVVTTATDVYSLGVILYELLTGHHPHRPGDGSRRVEDVIREEEPERPSTVVMREATSTSLSGQNSDSPVAPSNQMQGGQGERLGRRLAGDLDNMVLMALRKDPQRRYASVQQFSEDIGRHLDGRPVIARPDTLTYRMTKFVQRNKASVGTATALTFGLLIGLAGTVWQAHIASLQRDAERHQRERAEANLERAVSAETKAAEEARVAGQVSEFLVELFQVADPSEQRGTTITAREILDRGAEKVRSELADQPLVQARLMLTMGDVYRNLGLYESAMSLLEESVAIRRAHLDATDPLLAESIDRLGLAYRSLSQSSKAEACFREALALRLEQFGEKNVAVADTLNNLGLARYDQADYANAKAHYTRALRIYEDLFGHDHSRVAVTTNNLALLAEAEHDYEEAERLYRNALAIKQRVLPADSPSTLITMNGLATTLLRRGDMAAAETMLREVLELAPQILGPDHPHVATCMNNLATTLSLEGKYAEAEPMAREVVARRRRLLGNGHRSVAVAVNNLANVLRNERKFQEAEAMYQEALRLAGQTLGESHPRYARTLLGMARCYINSGRPREAWPLLGQAREILMASGGDGGWPLAFVKASLGRCLQAEGKFEEAEPLLLEGFESQLARLGSTHLFTKQLRDHVVDFYIAWGKPEKAAQYRGADGTGGHTPPLRQVDGRGRQP